MAQTPYSADEPIGDEHQVDLDATPARQGMRGVHILWVLIISLVLAGGALLTTWAFRSQDLAAVQPNASAQPSEAQNFDSTAGGVVRQK